MASTTEKPAVLKPAVKPKPSGYVFGRPTKYKKEFCQQLIDHMASGLSFEAFAGVAMVCEATLSVWAADHPDFLDAKRLGFGMSRFFWENLGREASRGKVKGFVPAVYIFTMKNRFHWSDRSDLRIEVAEDFKKDHELLRDIPRKELLALAKRA